MPTTIKNIATGEQIVIGNGRGYNEDGNVLFRPDYTVSANVMAKYHIADILGRNSENKWVLKLEEGWECVATPRRPRKPKAKDEPTDAEVIEYDGEDSEEQREKEAKIFFKDFEDICQDVRDGYNVYMYGPAGAGKSHTAQAIAEALGLPYYEMNQLFYAHDVVGYGNAAGEYVPTPFYEAVTKGGLIFIDEYDRSAQCATTLINTILANRRFTFPVIGNVEAHPDFRCIAAGNTAMRPDAQYTTAVQIDASSRDRFIFYPIDYDRRVEVKIQAKGDTTLVDFMEDLRRAIKESKIDLVCSPRATKYLKERENKKVKALERGLFKGLDADEINNLYSLLTDKNNPWAKAMKDLVTYLILGNL